MTSNQAKFIKTKPTAISTEFNLQLTNFRERDIIELLDGEAVITGGSISLDDASWYSTSASASAITHSVVHLGYDGRVDTFQDHLAVFELLVLFRLIGIG